MKTIGILGGLAPASTIACYACITETYYELRQDYAYPEILIHSFCFQDFINAGYEVADRVEAAIKGLHQAGADFVIAACNSVHIVYDQVAPRSPIPWISIMDATAEAVLEQGMTRVGLLGTRFTMEKGFYHRGLEKRGIEALTPDLEGRKRIHEIIYNELVRGVVREPSRRRVLECVEDLCRRGAEGVVLGCTELPFLIEQRHTETPVFDTASIHARKALDLAMR